MLFCNVSSIRTAVAGRHITQYILRKKEELKFAVHLMNLCSFTNSVHWTTASVDTILAVHWTAALTDTIVAVHWTTASVFFLSQEKVLSKKTLVTWRDVLFENVSVATPSTFLRVRSKDRFNPLPVQPSFVSCFKLDPCLAKNICEALNSKG